jgi:hypothetical protein
MKDIFILLTVLVLAIVIGLTGNRWLGATQSPTQNATQNAVGTIVTRTMSRPVGTKPPPGWETQPANHPSVLHRVDLDAMAIVLPGRRVKVTAHSDITSSPQAEDYLYAWKLEFTRRAPGQKSEVVWAWTYENSQVGVKPGTHTTPEFTDTVILPAGEYKARVSLLRMTWEDGVDGWQLVPVKDDYRLTSTRVVVK